MRITTVSTDQQLLDDVTAALNPSEAMLTGFSRPYLVEVVLYVQERARLRNVIAYSHGPVVLKERIDSFVEVARRLRPALSEQTQRSMDKTLAGVHEALRAYEERQVALSHPRQYFPQA